MCLSHGASLSFSSSQAPFGHGSNTSPRQNFKTDDVVSGPSSSTSYSEDVMPPHDPTLPWTFSLDPQSCLSSSMWPPYQKFPTSSHSH